MSTLAFGSQDFYIISVNKVCFIEEGYKVSEPASFLLTDGVLACLQTGQYVEFISSSNFIWMDFADKLLLLKCWCDWAFMTAACVHVGLNFFQE